MIFYKSIERKRKKSRKMDGQCLQKCLKSNFQYGLGGGLEAIGKRKRACHSASRAYQDGKKRFNIKKIAQDKPQNKSLLY